MGSACQCFSLSWGLPAAQGSMRVSSASCEVVVLWERTVHCCCKEDDDAYMTKTLKLPLA